MCMGYVAVTGWLRSVKGGYDPLWDGCDPLRDGCDPLRVVKHFLSRQNYLGKTSDERND